jgi:MoaA/NifB/PqqE/SkfB family radical SAM enzyme
MNKIISIKPVPEYFVLTWMVGSICNYDCMYCPSYYHDSSSKQPDLDSMKSAWKNIYEKSSSLGLPYRVVFTGGEITAIKNFLPLLKWLRENYENVKMVSATSNGSASLNYYEKLCNLLESLTLSIHSEHIDEKNFFAKSKKLNLMMPRPQKSFHVNVMNEHWNQDRIGLYKKILDQHLISYSINEINYKYRTREFPIMKGNLNLE